MPRIKRFRYRNNIKVKKHHREGRGVFSWLKINIILVIIIFISLVAMVLYSPIFMITTINYTPEDNFNNESINNLIMEGMDKYSLFFLPQKNILLFDPAPVTRAFSDHPYIRTLSITKKPLHTLNVVYELRNPEFIITNGVDYFLVDTSGYVLSSLDTIEGFDNLPIINDSIANYKVTDKVSYYKYLQTIQTIWNQLKFKFQDFDPVAINLLVSNSELRVTTSEGWYILFNLDDDVEYQLKVLNTVINNNIENRESLEYIDLRVSDWVYYK